MQGSIASADALQGCGMVWSRTSWQLHDGFDPLELTIEDGPTPLDAGECGFPPLVATSLSEPTTRAVATEVYCALTGEWPSTEDGSGGDAHVADTLAAAARSGRLRFRARPLPTRTSGPRSQALREQTAPSPPPAPADTWFEIRVVDEVGTPVADLDLVIDLGGRPRSQTTNGDGRVRLVAPDSTSGVNAELVSIERARALLHPRWRSPRTPRVPVHCEDAPVHERTLDTATAPVPMRRERVTTLVLRPSFACRAITAAMFEFGRSFPRREGLPALAEVAVALGVRSGVHGWIFGHTDRAGDELLNKQLSERRAQAVLALLTHDAAIWEQLWQGRTRAAGHERWGVRELQHMLAALGCRDEHGLVPREDGRMGPCTRAAIASFQRGEGVGGAGSAPLVADGRVTDETLRALFLAYAQRVTAAPVEGDRIDSIGDARSMGCGEFNPLSWAARDRESRRTVVFLFDPAARPAAPPCATGTLSPCHARLAAPPKRGASGPFARCEFYRGLACCHGEGGDDQTRDVLVRVLVNPRRAHTLVHRFVLEADDDAITEATTPSFRDSQELAREARAVLDAGGHATAMVELEFAHVPAAPAYRLRVEGVAAPYTVFARTRFEEIGKLAGATCAAARVGAVKDALFEAG